MINELINSLLCKVPRAHVLVKECCVCTIYDYNNSRPVPVLDWKKRQAILSPRIDQTFPCKIFLSVVCIFCNFAYWITFLVSCDERIACHEIWMSSYNISEMIYGVEKDLIVNNNYLCSYPPTHVGACVKTAATWEVFWSADVAQRSQKWTQNCKKVTGALHSTLGSSLCAWMFMSWILVIFGTTSSTDVQSSIRMSKFVFYSFPC